ncbi:hypothetical protein [Photobacterium gaetbulicola]|nr:hypothetical protein [Photobacterium gaetbulicola]
MKNTPVTVMKQISDWSEAELVNGNVEENSGLGKAVSCFISTMKG